VLRLDLYQQTLQLIAQRPLLGFGGGSFEWAYQLVHLPTVAPEFRWDRAHNTYLALWAELGVPVGSLVIVLIALIGGRVSKAMASGVGSWTAQAACLGVVVAGGLHSLVDFSLEIQANTLLFLAICAAGLAASLAVKRA
jgi:O-antigen ligase